MKRKLFALVLVSLFILGIVPSVVSTPPSVPLFGDWKKERVTGNEIELVLSLRQEEDRTSPVEIVVEEVSFPQSNEGAVIILSGKNASRTLLPGDVWEHHVLLSVEEAGSHLMQTRVGLAQAGTDKVYARKQFPAYVEKKYGKATFKTYEQGKRQQRTAEAIKRFFSFFNPFNWFKSDHDDAGDAVDVPVTVERGELSPQGLCESGGGMWKEFTNGCGDSCSLARNPTLRCTQALKYGCDCGKERCWNGHSCEAD